MKALGNQKENKLVSWYGTHLALRMQEKS